MRSYRTKPPCNVPHTRAATRTSPLALAALTALVILLATNRASAQSLAAEALFNEGRTLMDAGDYVHACPKLAESQRMDPGTGTLLNLGICYQKAGKTASAWGTFKEAAVLARRDNRADRVTYAQEQIALLEPGLSYLTVVVGDATKTIGLAVQVDGAALGEGAWGTAIPTDPGKHHLEATAPGRQAWTTDVELGANGDKQSTVIPALAIDALAPLAQPQEAVKPVEEKPIAAVPERSSRKTVAYVVGGVGVAALGVGTYFGARALSSWGSRKDHCTSAGCDAFAVSYGDDAKRYGNFANVGLGIGLVGVGVGTYLLVTAPSSSRISVEPTVARDAMGMSVGGVW